MVFNFRPIGVQVSRTKNVTLDHNVIGHIVTRTTFDSDGKVEDKEACLATCTYFSEDGESCPDTWVTNNIIGGCHWLGASLIGHACGKPELSKTTGNIVHSVSRSKGGVGVIITPDYSSKT